MEFHKVYASKALIFCGVGFVDMILKQVGKSFAFFLGLYFSSTRTSPRVLRTLFGKQSTKRKKKELKVNPETGMFVNDPAATAKRKRTYEKGWEPTV